jgi:hypothetical protein
LAHRAVVVQQAEKLELSRLEVVDGMGVAHATLLPLSSLRLGSRPWSR